MTGKRISELPRVPLPLSLNELVPAVASGQTATVTLGQIRGGRFLSIADFGAVGDGEEDDTPAFVEMHRALLAEQQADPERPFVLLLPPGHYRYTWNRWLWGLRNVTVFGYGARIQCVNGSKWNFDKYPLVTNRGGFQRMALDAPAQPAGLDFGRLIESAGPGETSVTLKDPAESERFSPGRQALVMSYDQQLRGYPPNNRYFDYVIVAGVQDGIVSFDPPLRHVHSSDYPEFGEYSTGRARIVDIDRDDVPHSRYQALLGLSIVRNPHLEEDATQYVLAQGVDTFVARDCDFISFIPSLGRSFEVFSSTIGYSEPDKFVDTLSYVGCTIRRLTQATGVNRLTCTACAFSHAVSPQARTARFEGCTLLGATQPGDFMSGVSLVGFAPTASIDVSNCMFYGKGNPTDCAVGPVGLASNALFNVSLGEPFELQDDGIVAVSKTEEVAVSLLRTLEIGGTFLLGRLQGGQVFSDGRYGKVQSIASDEDYIYLKLSSPGPLSAEDVLIAPRVRRLTSRGNTYHGVRSAVPITYETTVENQAIASEKYRFGARPTVDSEVVTLLGYLQEISVHVFQPFSGAAGAFLRVERHYPPDGDFAQLIDLREPGRREMSRHGILGAAGMDSLVPIPARQFVWSVRISHAVEPKGPNTALSGSSVELPDYAIEVRTENPFLRR